MPEMIQFTQNYEDLSTDRGFQFKFFCDKCGNGYMSRFKASPTGTVGGVLRAAGSLFGGVLDRAADSAYEVQRQVGGKQHDAALAEAAEEGKKHFHQCPRCGNWVCPEVCWNPERGLCQECAPDVVEEMAAAQAQATRDQIIQKAASQDYTKELDLQATTVVTCPSCGAKTAGGKFCPECGAALAKKTECPKCGAELAAGAKFCSECGQKM